MRNKLFYQYQNNFFNKLSKHTGLPLHFYKNKNLLDIGCGEGDDSIKFSKSAKKVTAVDIEEFPSWAQVKSKKLIFRKANAEKLPFKTKSFDVVFSKDMLHHTPNPGQALKEIQRVIKKEGIVIIIEGNRYNPLSYIHMTKLKGHEHFPQKVFRKMVLADFHNARFYTFESHFIPFFGSRLLFFFFKLEDLVEKIPLIKPLLSYNIAVIKLNQ